MKYEPLVADRFYHIFNRGNNREDLFIEERSYSYFLKLLEKHITPVAFIYSVFLLKNHFHLLIRTKEEIEDQLISKAFSNLFNANSKSINKAYERRGSLFQDTGLKELKFRMKLSPNFDLIYSFKSAEPPNDI